MQMQIILGGARPVPGRCIPLVPGSMSVTVSLRQLIIPSGVTLVHIAPTMALDLRTAPFEFSVMAASLEDPSRLHHMGNFRFNHTECGQQTFAVDPAIPARQMTFQVSQQAHHKQEGDPFMYVQSSMNFSHIIALVHASPTAKCGRVPCASCPLIL